jgi:hypothetical protein
MLTPDRWREDTCASRDRNHSTQQLGIHQDDQTVAAVQQAVDLHLLRANSRDDPAMVCITYDGIRLAEKR